MVTERPLDVLNTAELVEEVIRGQDQVVSAVRAAAPELAAAVEVVCAIHLAGGRIVLLGAGTSGQLAVMEAAEVPGTYGIADECIVARVAGGGAGQLVGSDGAEDDEELGRNDISELGVGAADVVIVVAASGTTPYTVAAALAGREAGAAVIAIVSVEGSPLAALADVAIQLPVGPEVVLGSTRLAAGSAQKLALNTLTTAVMVRSGHVHGRFMVDVVPANKKLRRRAAGLVAASCGVSSEVALSALQACSGNARAAIVHLSTGLPPEHALALSASHRTVREAIDAARSHS